MKNFIFFLPLLLMSFHPAKNLSVHDFKVASIDGKEIQLSAYKGKKMLVVNVASRCGYTPQYKDLEALYRKYSSKLVVLGFPANNFGAQEPGTNDDIKSFCQKNYGVSFPMFAKISVKGSDQAPLYAFLADKSRNGATDEVPNWNFCKYLIDENGKVLKFFPSSVNPLDKAITDLL